MLFLNWSTVLFMVSTITSSGCPLPKNKFLISSNSLLILLSDFHLGWGCRIHQLLVMSALVSPSDGLVYHLERPSLWGMPTGPDAFLRLPGTYGFQFCSCTYLKRPSAWLVRLVERITNTRALVSCTELGQNNS